MKHYLNEQYGKLTVIEHLSDKKHKRGLVLLCRCECGNVLEKISSDLEKSRKLNQVASCGCAKDKDITGNKYGMLTAISKIRVEKGKGAIWLFKCDCGNEVEKVGSYVDRMEGALHCGCSRKTFTQTKNEKGKRYGKLLVLEYSGIDDKQRAMWLCKCDCGSEEIYSGYVLRRGKTHCGCVKKDPLNVHSWKGVGEIPQSYFSSVENNAKIRKLDFDITIEDMWDKFLEQNGVCALSGQTMLPPLAKNNKNPLKSSLDRISSDKGYVKDNIQWVVIDVNNMKSNLTEEYFVRLCKLVAENRS